MNEYVGTLIGNIITAIVNPLMLLLIGAALVYFLWGVAVFLKDFDSPEARSKGKQHMVWGIIGMVIMVSVFGIMCGIGHTINAPFDVLNSIPFCW